MKLRPYQIEAIDAIKKSWEQYRSTLLVLPTGCGKTIVFATLAAELAKTQRVLILAHRDELLRQASDKIHKACGVETAFEKAGETCLGSFYNITCGSVQTLMRIKRLERFPKDYFGTIIIDEAHHALSDSYANILNYFDSAKVLGVTATPDRGDKQSLATVFDDIAYEYGIREAIGSNFLSGIVVQTMPLKIDLDSVKITKGDYDVKALGDTLIPYLDEIANCIPKDRKTLVFLPLIATSKEMCEILKSKGFRAEHIDGKSEDRREILQRLSEGKIDVLCNSMLLTEGFDEPSIDCVVCLRATKSRALYAQIIGRGTRLAENKKNLLVLDFLWHSSKHDICHAAHLIAPKFEVAKKMKEISAGGAVQELLELEEEAESSTRAETESRLARTLRGMSHKKSSLINPLDYALRIHSDRLLDYSPDKKWEMKPPTQAQLEELQKKGFELENINTCGLASKIINTLKEREALGLISAKQMRLLSKRKELEGKDIAMFTKDTATAMISRLIANNWKGF